MTHGVEIKRRKEARPLDVIQDEDVNLIEQDQKGRRKETGKGRKDERLLQWQAENGESAKTLRNEAAPGTHHTGRKELLCWAVINFPSSLRNVRVVLHVDSILMRRKRSSQRAILTMKNKSTYHYSVDFWRRTICLLSVPTKLERVGMTLSHA